MSEDHAFLIEAAKPVDFLAIAALDRVAWSGNRETGFIADGEHTWRIWCEHALVFVARSDKADVAGAIVAFPCLDGDYCLHKIMFAESFRGMGGGRQLLQALLHALEARARSCFLTVDPMNVAAVKLYRKLGFEIERTVKGYYRPSEDRHIMVRRFLRR